MNKWHKLWHITGYLLLFFTLFFCTGSEWTGMETVQAAGGAIRITLDDTVVETDVPPYIDENSRTMVPVRFVTQGLGCYVEWNQEEQQIRVSRSGIVVELYIGQKIARVNGTEKGMDTTAVLKEGRTMVPLRFLAETFGLEVSWKQEDQTVALRSPSQPAAPPAAPTPPATEPRMAIVTGDVVNIRSGPGTDYNRLTQVLAGTRLTVLAAEGEWFLVELPGGEKGWIAGWLVELHDPLPGGATELGENDGLPSNVARSALVMKDSVNIRSGPGVENPVITKVNTGQQLKIIGEQNGWFAVSLPDGQKGWVAGWLAAVMYDADKKETAAGETRPAELISRWSAGEHSMDGDLPLITSVEVGRSGEGVLLKISSGSRLALPSSFRLENPSRLVFDFQARLAEESVAPTLQAKHGPVACFRLGQFDEQTVRIVADLQAPASYALTQDSSGRTITIQIQPVDATKKIIVIDPGHGSLQEWGSSDPGAIGPTGLRERDVVRSISLQLGNILLNEGFTVIYTRETNTGLSLEERASVANISGAELLVSIHANASTNRSLSGTMTFYHAPGGAQAGQISARKTLANLIQAELLNRLQRKNGGVREANFLVLRSCPIPAVLVEVAYISNPEEEKLLADPAFQRRAAEAIALGIKRYLVAQKN
ncbi:MAG TPA: hypothetical protein DCD97_04265 [Firmicutes bacterium]|jgi:N-acetylmuramoyl-L-alanine amidase|nr:hypothetical protein [Bacillota bacterium]